MNGFPAALADDSKVEVTRSAKVRRAKLYYLRDLKGKAARMKDTVKSLKVKTEKLKAESSPESDVLLVLTFNF